MYPDKIAVSWHLHQTHYLVFCCLATGILSLMHFRWIFKFHTGFQLCSLQKEKQLDTSAYLNFQRKLLCLQGLRLAKFCRRVHWFLKEDIQHHTLRHTKFILAFWFCFCFYYGPWRKENLPVAYMFKAWNLWLKFCFISTILHTTHTHASIIIVPWLTCSHVNTCWLK